MEIFQTRPKMSPLQMQKFFATLKFEILELWEWVDSPTRHGGANHEQSGKLSMQNALFVLSVINISAIFQVISR